MSQMTSLGLWLRGRCKTRSVLRQHFAVAVRFDSRVARIPTPKPGFVLLKAGALYRTLSTMSSWYGDCDSDRVKYMELASCFFMYLYTQPVVLLIVL